MKHSMLIFRIIMVLSVFLSISTAWAQGSRTDFWQRVSYGGNLGLSFGSDYFSASVAPSAIYTFNPYFSAGPGLNFTYVKDDFYKAAQVGGSLIALVNPYRYVQFSAELEELYVNQKIQANGPNYSRDFWNTALFLGLGYRTGPVTVGVRYNVLYEAENRVYPDAFRPFVRIYF